MVHLGAVALVLSATCSLALGSTVQIQARVSEPVVDLGYAKYQGFWNESADVTQFLGMRFAAPPTGSLRFQAPKAPSKIKGVQVANSFPPTCIQGNTGAADVTPFLVKRDTLPASEDCLFLNVITPGKLNADQKLPVVFFIHGGGYVGGSQDGSDGSNLIHDAMGGVVAVIIQYRLGAYGFLPGSAVKQHGALNAGLLDQEFALQWVQKYISNFGGDPTKVTIWGQSAGAGSVFQHVVAHGGKTTPALFRSAMTSSTFVPSQYSYDAYISEALYSLFVESAGCSSAKNTFNCLVEADSATLMAANNDVSISGLFGTYIFVPVVDGDFIVESPTATLLKGNANGEHLLAVTNTFEGTQFVSEPDVSNNTLSEYVGQLFPTLDTIQISAVVAQYTNIGLETTFDQAVGIMGESIFICPAYLLMSAFPGKAYKAEFAIPPGGHGEDLPYYFVNHTAFGIQRTFNNPSFIASFSESFMSVVKFNNPTSIEDPMNVVPSWPVYDQGNIEMVFNETASMEIDIHKSATNSGLLERCNFWQTLASIIGQ